MQICLIILAALALIWFFLVHPRLRHGRCARWRGQRFAHRGLHGGEIAENTMRAFEAACRAGVGIELDVRFSRDGQVVVYHDDDLSRLCGDSRRVDELTAEELGALSVGGRGEGVPIFRDVLERVNGRAPLLVELKTCADKARLCRDVMALLDAYKGEYVVESFDPMMLLWVRRHAPKVIHGQLVTTAEDYGDAVRPIAAFCLSRLLLNCLSRPDFIAYNVNAERFFAPRVQRTLFGAPMAAWTVRDASLDREVTARGEMSIFEGLQRKV